MCCLFRLLPMRRKLMITGSKLVLQRELWQRRKEKLLTYGTNYWK